MKKLFIISLTTLFLFGCQSETTEEPVTDSRSIEEIAADFNQDLLSENYEVIERNYNFTKQVKPYMRPASLEKIFTDLDCGKILEQQESFTQEANGYQIVSTPTIFERKNFNVNLVFDENKLIAGFNVSPFTGTTDLEDNDTFMESKLVAKVNDLELNGIFTTPKNVDDYPIVILVHGSGASDKDETIFENKPFKDIAHALATQGIASYRYDKGTFASPQSFADKYDFTVYEETINDAVKIYEMIKGQNPDSDVYILGHSLGGHLIPLIAEEVDASGYVIMAGNVRSLLDLLKEQIPYLINLDGTVTAEEKAYQETFNAEIEKLENLDSLADDEAVIGGYKAYWAFLENYKPLEKAQSISSKVLVVQGERDYQVTMEDFNLWKTLEKDNFTYISYPTLNHLMMPGEGQPNPEEYQVKSTVSQTFIDDMASWIKE